MANQGDIFDQAGQKYGIDPGLLRAVAHVESRGNPNAVSPAGAVGVMQIMPSTAKGLGIDPASLTDPNVNVMAGAQVLAQNMKKFGNVNDALRAYNGGWTPSKWNNPETAAYVPKVMAAYKGQPAMPQQSTVTMPWQQSTTSQQADPFSSLMAGKPAAVQSASPAGGNDPFSQMMAKNSSPVTSSQQQYDPTSGMSTFDKMAAGAGKSVVDLGNGIKQLAAEAGNKVGLVSDQTVQNLRQQATETALRDAPLMNTGAGQAGYLGGTIATTLVPAGLAAKGAQAAGAAETANALRAITNPATYKSAATVGAVQGAMQPVGVDDSRTANMLAGAAGGMAGNALANGISRVAQPVMNKLSPVMQKSVDTLSASGVPLDAAQQTGSPILNRIKSALGDNPFTSSAEAAKRAEQQGAYNNAVLNTIGTSGSAATPEVMNAAKQQIGQVFNDVAARNPVHFDNQLNQSVTDILNGAKNELSEQQMGIISRQVDNVLEKANNPDLQIDGKAYQNIKSSLDRVSSGSDQAVGFWARKLRNALDDGLERSTALNGNPDDYQALQLARQQWGNLKKIEGAVDAEGNGNISPAKLANIVNQKANRASSVYGQGDQTLPDLAKAGKNLLTDKLANSGTPARAALQIMAPALIGGSYGALQGDWEKAGIGAVGGIALPKAAQAVINNPATAQYLSHGVSNDLVRQLLNAPRDNPVANLLLRRLLTPMPPVAQGVGFQQPGQ